MISSVIHSATLDFVNTTTLNGLAAASFGLIEVTSNSNIPNVLRGKQVKSNNAIDTPVSKLFPGVSPLGFQIDLLSV